MGTVGDESALACIDHRRARGAGGRFLPAGEARETREARQADEGRSLHAPAAAPHSPAASVITAPDSRGRGRSGRARSTIDDTAAGARQPRSLAIAVRADV